MNMLDGNNSRLCSPSATIHKSEKISVYFGHFVTYKSDMMTANEFNQSLLRLNLLPDEAAQILSVTPRTIRRWQDDDEVSGTAEQAIRAWIRLHDRHLPWRPDSISLLENDQDQIARHRLNTIDLDDLISRVEQRGGARLPWIVDWNQGKAILGSIEVGFYKLQNGSFSLSTYRRMDGAPNIARDAEIIEDAAYCIAQALKKQNPDFGPVTLVVFDGPAKGRVASQKTVEFPTQSRAIEYAAEHYKSPGFHEPFIIAGNPSELLYPPDELRLLCDRSTAAPPALRAVATYTRTNSSFFVRNGPALLGPSETAQRRQQIESIADKIDQLARKAMGGLVSYREFDILLGALHAAGFFPQGELVSNVARALVGKRQTKNQQAG